MIYLIRNLFLKNIKRILSVFIITFIIISYFLLMFLYLKPNIPTYCDNVSLTDDYMYIADARNFALNSNLETKIYFAKSVVWGTFPSKSSNSMIFSFLMGLIIKLFGSKPWASFIINYVFAAAIFLISYFFLNLKDIKGIRRIVILILIAIFPVMVMEFNYIRMEAFFMFLITLNYYSFIKLKTKGPNYPYLIITIVSSILIIARYSFIFVALAMIGYMTYILLKEKKILKASLIVIGFILFSILLYYLFNTNRQLYFGETDSSIRYYIYDALRNNRINLFSGNFWLDIGNILKKILILLKIQLKNLANINQIYNYFWLFVFVTVLNGLTLIKFRRNTQIKKELLFVLIPEYLIFFSSIFIYTPILNESLRMIYAFIPINLLYISLYLDNIHILKTNQIFKLRNLYKILLIIILIFFIIMISINTYPSFKQFKTNKNQLLINNFNNLKKVVEKYRINKKMNICGDFVGLPDYIVYSDDYLITTNYFSLSVLEFAKLIELDLADLIILNNDSCIKNDDYAKYLYEYEYGKIQVEENNYAILYHKKSDKNIEFLERIDKNNYKNKLAYLNQCSLDEQNDYIFIKSFGIDPYFGFKNNLSFKEDKEYYLKIYLIVPVDTFFQIFYKFNNDKYMENRSYKESVTKGENILIIKLQQSEEIKNLRVDIGNTEGIYLLKYIEIFSVN